MEHDTQERDVAVLEDWNIRTSEVKHSLEVKPAL